MKNLVAEDKTDVDTPTKSTSREPQRLTVNLPPAMIDDLKKLAEEEGVTVTEIVRRAIGAERFLRDHINAGNKIFIHEKGEKEPTRIVVFR